MSLKLETNQYYKNRAKLSKLAIEGLKKMKSRRVYSHLLFSLLTPFFYVILLFIFILGMLSSSFKKSMLAKYIRTYLKWYFTLKGITSVCVEPIPESFESPTLILLPRYNTYSSLFAFQLFKSPVIIPLYEKFKKFRDNVLIPTSFIGRSFKCISYPDQNLDVCFERVKGLLKKGHSVVLHINQDTTNTMYDNKFYISTLFKEVLDLKYDTYFLRIRGWENYHIATFMSPIPITVNFVKKETLLEGIDHDKIRKQVSKIVEYFDYRYFELENHD
jgi:hypothetical protein